MVAKVAIIVFPGSNCDRDVAMAAHKTLGASPIMVWHDDQLPKGLDLIIIPGGFSYGDYLRSGAIAARSRVMQDVIRFASNGGYVLGICNGFQILTEAGLLPGTLIRNQKLKFVAKQVSLKVNNTKSIFTSGYSPNQIIQMPIAHGDGNYFADSDTVQLLQDNEQLAMSYHETNPNGSLLNIAAITNKNNNVFGMMPHPERAIDKLTGSEDGQYLFDSVVRGIS